jgi:Zn-dependent protease with chaperone function
MQREFTGSYLDGKIATRQRATIRLLPNGLQILTERGPMLLWRYADVRRTQGLYAGEQVRLEHGGPMPEVLLVSDAAFLTALQTLLPRLGSRVHDSSHRGMRVALTVLAGLVALGLVVILYSWGIPALAAMVAPRVPVSWEEQFGRAVVEQLAPPGRRCNDPDLQQRLDDIVAALTAAAPRSPYTFRVIVADDSDLNAFAAPGGYIVVLRGLLEKTDSAEELAGVLAHEVQHIVHHHTTRALFQHVSTGLLIAALTGDASGLAAFGLDSARTLGLLQYSRSHEAEADADGMRMVLAAGIDPAGMIAFYELLNKEGPHLPNVLQYASSHPSTTERIDRLKALAAHPPAHPMTLVQPEEWLTLRNACATDDEPASPDQTKSSVERIG